jgi:PadR family transcriptional regulator PadR
VSDVYVLLQRREGVERCAGARYAPYRFRERRWRVNDGTLGVPSDWLVPFLLLGLREQDSCEPELTSKMAGSGFEATRPGEMYRALRYMEQEGMIASEHDGFDGKPSLRRYSITESGEAYLKIWASTLERYRGEINLFFRTYADGSARDGTVDNGVRGEGTGIRSS